MHPQDAPGAQPAALRRLHPDLMERTRDQRVGEAAKAAINAANLGFQKSFDIIIMVVLGGMGSISGSIIAATVLTTLAAWQDGDFCRERLGLDAPLGAIDRSRLNVTGSSRSARE